MHLRFCRPTVLFPLLLAVTVAAPRTARAQHDAAPAAAADAAVRAVRGAHAHNRVARRVARRVVRRIARGPAPLHYERAGTAAALSQDLGALLDARVRSGQWGAMVVSLTRGDTLFSRDADSAMRPASTMKLFTTALALDRFGPDHEFTTDILRRGTVDASGTLHGDLILRGGGDPSLSHRFIAGGAGAAMAEAAQLVAAAGVKRVTGHLIADATAFDSEPIPDGWHHRYLQSAYAAPVSALSLDENVVTVVVAPRTHRAPEANVSLDPVCEIPVVSHVRTVVGRAAHVVAHEATEGTIIVSGWIGTHAHARRLSLVVDDPPAFAAGAFRRALAARGIAVTGGTELGPAPRGAVRIGALTSPPLAKLLAAMNGESINHYAELFFRDAGGSAAADHIGSVASADAALRPVLARSGIAPAAVLAVDGSGLSPLDHVTPRALVDLLAYAERAPWHQTFEGSLPVAGASALLRKRMRFTPAQGKLQAKTGTTDRVVSLAGYVTARDGERLVFAFVYNGTDRWRARMTIDALGETLAAFTRA